MKTAKLLAPLLLGMFVTLAATPKAEAQPADRAARVEARKKEVRARLLRNKVGLDESKAGQVEKILDQHAKERKALQQERMRHQQKLKQLLQADSNDQKAYSTAISGFRTADKKLRALRDKEMDALAKVLTPKQQAQLAVAAKQVQRDIRQRMQRRPRRPRP